MMRGNESNCSGSNSNKEKTDNSTAIEQKSDDGPSEHTIDIATEQRKKGYLRNPRKLTHHSKDNEASHFQRKNTASGSCLTSLLNMQTIVYKIFSHEKTSRTVYSIKTMSQPIFISQKSLTKIIKNFWKSIVPEKN